MENLQTLIHKEKKKISQGEKELTFLTKLSKLPGEICIDGAEIIDRASDCYKRATNFYIEKPEELDKHFKYSKMSPEGQWFLRFTYLAEIPNKVTVFCEKQGIKEEQKLALWIEDKSYTHYVCEPFDDIRVKRVKIYHPIETMELVNIYRKFGVRDKVCDYAFFFKSSPYFFPNSILANSR